MIAVATKGGNKYIGADPIIFNAHEVGLKIQAASTYMTVGLSGVVFGGYDQSGGDSWVLG